MKNIRQTKINIHRDSWVEINISNLEHNIKEIKKFVPTDTKLLGVVKADAYGHGSVMLAPVILASGIDMLGVASIDEGIDLRNANINCEILVLGAVPVWAVESAVNADLSIAIFSYEHIEACKSVWQKTGKKPKVHVKLDTGMNRIGVPYEIATDFIKEVQKEFYKYRNDEKKLKEENNYSKDNISKANIDPKWKEFLGQVERGKVTSGGNKVPSWNKFNKYINQVLPIYEVSLFIQAGQNIKEYNRMHLKMLSEYLAVIPEDKKKINRLNVFMEEMGINKIDIKTLLDNKDLIEEHLQEEELPF